MVEKRCRVCGSPETVKAHLFPAALSHDIRGDAKHVVSIKAEPVGPQFHQSGEWSNAILCRTHEAALHVPEQYAIKFCRRFDRIVDDHPRSSSLAIANPRPDLLVAFAHIVVWRYGAALEQIGRRLGPYLTRIQEVIFDNAQPLEVVVLEAGHRRRGRRMKLGVIPTTGTLSGVRIVRFDIGGLCFILKVDKRPFHPVFAGFDASRDPIEILIQDPVEVLSNPLIRELMTGRRLTPDR